jgi:hypothetical protein
MAINTLRVAKRLREAHFTESQAEAVTAAVQEATQGAELATTVDLAEVKRTSPRSRWTWPRSRQTSPLCAVSCANWADPVASAPAKSVVIRLFGRFKFVDPLKISVDPRRNEFAI